VRRLENNGGRGSERPRGELPLISPRPSNSPQARSFHRLTCQESAATTFREQIQRPYRALRSLTALFGAYSDMYTHVPELGMEP